MDYPVVLSNLVPGVDVVSAKHINNLEAKVGIDNSAVATSLDYRLGILEDAYNSGALILPLSLNVGHDNVLAEDTARDTGLLYPSVHGFFNKLFSWYGFAAGAGNYVDGKISGAVGNTNIATANDSFVCGNRNVVGRRQWGIDGDGGSHGVDDPGLGVGNRAYVIIADKYGDVTGFFPNAQFDAAKVLACYGAGATIDGGNIYANGYSAPADLTWAMHPYMIVRDAAVETGITLIKILKATYAGGVGTKIWYDSATELYATISFVYGSYSPVVVVYGIEGGNGQFGAGRFNSTWGYSAHAEGTLCRAWNKNAHAQGFGAEALGEGSFASGYYCKAAAYHSSAFGRYNVGGGTSGSWVASDPLFEIGVGADANNLFNAFTVLKSGRIGINKAVPTYSLDVVGLAADTYLAKFSHAKTDALMIIENATAANVNNTAGIQAWANTTVSMKSPWQIYGGYIDITDATRTSNLKFLTINSGAQVEVLRLQGANLGIGGVTAFGTALAKGVGLASGTAPSDAPANMGQFWVEDINGAAGYAGLHMMAETTALKEIVVGAVIKTDTGSPANPHGALMEINEFDNKIRVYADGGWRQIATW